MDASAICKSTRRSSASVRRVTHRSATLVLARRYTTYLPSLRVSTKRANRSSFRWALASLTLISALGAQGFDSLLALTQQFDEFQALRAGNGFANTGYLLVELVLEFSHAFILMNV